MIPKKSIAPIESIQLNYELIFDEKLGLSKWRGYPDSNYILDKDSLSRTRKIINEEGEEKNVTTHKKPFEIIADFAPETTVHGVEGNIEEAVVKKFGGSLIGFIWVDKANKGGGTVLLPFIAPHIFKATGSRLNPTIEEIHTSSAEEDYYEIIGNKTFVHVSSFSGLGGAAEAAAALIAHYKMNENTANDNDELVTNGNFAAWTADSPDDWDEAGEVGNDPEISEAATGEAHADTPTPGGGMCNIYTSGSYVAVKRVISLIVGRKYRFSINVDNITAGGLEVNIGQQGVGTDFSDIFSGAETGIHTAVFTSVEGANTFLEVKRNSGATDITFDDVSIKLCAVEDSSGNDHDGLAQQDTEMIQVGGNYWHPFIDNQGILVEDFEDVTDWSVVGAGATAENETVIFKRGSQSVKLNAVNGTSSYIQKTISLDSSVKDSFCLWVYVEDCDKVDSLRIDFSTTLDWSKFLYRIFSGSKIVTGWNYLAFSKSEFSNYNADSWGTMLKVRCFLIPSAGLNTSAYFDDLRLGRTGKPKVIVSFDDNYNSQILEAYPILAGNNQAGVIFGYVDAVGADGRMTVAQMQTLQVAGWDISNHGEAHLHLTDVSQEAMEADIDGGYDWLVANGFGDTAKFFSYPYSEHNDAVLAKVKERHVLVRTPGISPSHFYITGFYNDLQYRIDSYSFSVPTAAAVINAEIDKVIASSGLLVLVFHRVVDSGATGNDILTAEFQTVSDYLKTKQDAGDLEVITFSDYYNELVNNVPKIKGSLGFNGVDDFIEIADHNDFTPALLPFSVSAWIYMHDATNFIIASKGVEGTDGEWRFYTDGSDKLLFHGYDESANKYIGRKYNTALTTYENQWVHLVATYDGSNLSTGIGLYINGVKVDDTTDEAATFVAVENLNHAVWIGRYGTNYANGLIDNVMFFSEELTREDVSALYKGGAGGEDLSRLFGGGYRSRYIGGYRTYRGRYL